MTIRVTSVQTKGDTATVRFADGHAASFTTPGAQSGRRSAFQTFRLARGDQEVAVFNSAHQNPVRRRPFGFVTLTQDYTPKHIYEYWQAAYTHVINGCPPDESLRPALLVIWRTSRDMNEVRYGRWLAP